MGPALPRRPRRRRYPVTDLYDVIEKKNPIRNAINYVIEVLYDNVKYFRKNKMTCMMMFGFI